MRYLMLLVSLLLNIAFGVVQWIREKLDKS